MKLCSQGNTDLQEACFKAWPAQTPVFKQATPNPCGLTPGDAMISGTHCLASGWIPPTWAVKLSSSTAMTTWPRPLILCHGLQVRHCLPEVLTVETL